MSQDQTGMRRYFYEHLFHTALDAARDISGELIPISKGRAIRASVDEHLLANGQSIDNPALPIRPFLEAIAAGVEQHTATNPELFPTMSSKDAVYSRSMARFATAMGIGLDGAKDSDKRIPVSPYDPRWALRGTVRAHGNELLFINAEHLSKDARGRFDQLHLVAGKSRMALMRQDEQGRESKAGAAFSLDDSTGISALMDKMSEQEYKVAKKWLVDGMRTASGRLDFDRRSSVAALDRCIAVLDYLRAEGLDYSVEPDMNPGQIKAKVSGSGLEIRLIDLADEAYAGARVYDNGLITRYSTNVTLGDKMATYTPKPAEIPALLDFARGKGVARNDQTGLVGASDLRWRDRDKQTKSAVLVPYSYHETNNLMTVVGDHPMADTQAGRRSDIDQKIMLRTSPTEGRTTPGYFRAVEQAQEFLETSVTSARENFEAALDVEALIEHQRTQLEEGVASEDLVAPLYASDPEVAAIQRSYWDVLTGDKDWLLRPGVTQEMYLERLEAIGEDPQMMDLGNMVYAGGSPQEAIRDHAGDVPYELIGTMEPMVHEVDGQWVEQRFHPTRVARWMTSATGQWSNQDNLAAALRRAQVDPHEMMGEGFQVERFKDRMLRFDPDSAKNLLAHDSPFLARVGQTLRTSVETNASTLLSAQIDDNGVISYEASKTMRKGEDVVVRGQIGQVFIPGEHGEIVTKFASGENTLVVPGYRARIIPQDPDGKPLSVEERTRLRGYEQLVTEKIQARVRNDLISQRSEVGEPSSINGLYSQITGTKHPVDFIDRAMHFNPTTQQIELDPWVGAILETEAARVRYDSQIGQGSTIFAEYSAQHSDRDPVNDNHFDAWTLTGGRNMAVLTGAGNDGIEATPGYFDPVMTGGATNQGIVRYLTQDAVVGPDGSIVPGDASTPTGSRAALMNQEELASMAYDPFDRQQMTASTIMQSSKITAPVGTALMTFGGWTADDPIVVSTDFAQAHQIRGAAGQLRDLVVGDKLSDLHGNKGVISLVVDRQMTLDQARAQGVEQEVAWFKANPQMDVVMSPFSLISRRNAGSARELMSSELDDLHAPDVSGQERLQAAAGAEPSAGSVTASGIGQMRFVVTHMAVDEKTKIYDDEQVRAGRGRKASSQLAWALQSQDCPAIMREFYGHNSGAQANLREHMLVMGLDMESDGTLRVVGEQESLEEGPARRFIPQPELIRNAKGFVMPSKMGETFGALIGDRGGDLELPFALTYPTGAELEAASDSTWKLPVLSSHLRSGQEFDDGGVVTHDYTSAYAKIFKSAVTYRAAQETLAAPKGEKSAKALAQARAVLANEPAKAQRTFDTMCDKIRTRVFEGKNNDFKTGIMSSRLSDSATMVWTSDPRLDVDQVALSSAKAQQLGLAEDDYALVWRDPILRDSGVRYMRVAINDQLTGAAINPVMDKCFDGDFDGDSVAVVKLHGSAAKAEAMRNLSVPANLLDTGVVKEDGTYPLAMHIALDTQVAISRNPELAEEFASLTTEINTIEREWQDHQATTLPTMDALTQQLQRADLDEEAKVRLVDQHSTLMEESSAFEAEITARREDVVTQLSDAYRAAQRSEFGSALSFGDRSSHLDSVREVCVDTGAKGNAMKLADYARNLGDDNGLSGLTKEDQEASMFAAAMKAHATGLGGSFSQRAVRALRGPQIKSVLEVTYPVTQSILQAKHDAAEARHKYEMLQGPGRELWRGRVLENMGAGKWSVPKQDGEPIQASTQEWQRQFIDFYTSKDGFGVDVNPDHVAVVAQALTDPKTGLIRNLEEEPELSGSLLDTMAYGGDFSQLVDAARDRRSLYESDFDAQFACSSTRAALDTTAAQLESIEGSWQASQNDVAVDALSKADVLADDVEQASTRGRSRRSGAAVAVSDPRAAAVPYRSISNYLDRADQTHESTDQNRSIKDEGMSL